MGLVYTIGLYSNSWTSCQCTCTVYYDYCRRTSSVLCFWWIHWQTHFKV